MRKRKMKEIEGIGMPGGLLLSMRRVVGASRPPDKNEGPRFGSCPDLVYGS